MSSSSTFFNDLGINPESSDSQDNEDMMDINEHVNDYAHQLPKPSASVASSVYELLECPVCLNAMYPPIHQVCLIYNS